MFAVSVADIGDERGVVRVDLPGAGVVLDEAFGVQRPEPACRPDERRRTRQVAR